MAMAMECFGVLEEAGELMRCCGWNSSSFWARIYLYLYLYLMASSQ
jgi:hypothetical protein